MEFDKPVTGGPCWTELGTSDLEGAKRFYADLFGWRPETDPRPEAGGYTVAHLADAPVAALTPLYQESQPVAWNVSFAVPDADAAVRRVEEAGGTVVLGPMDVFDMGRFAVVLDATGAAFQLWQARAFRGAGLFNAPGTLGWVELATRGTARARDFYTTVFDWSAESSEWYTEWALGGAKFGGMADMGDRFPPEMPPHWMPYFAVADVDATAEGAERAGGAVVLAPVTVPDGPRIAVLRDPQGAEFGVHLEGVEG
ncbi:VOC family protein [Streptomyces broussonetiae]|uniref:VOC family protein n=1 Tax=Streptomyces broussonetiae TaxID=2686304 RepID=A0A6I6N2H9_9ACTN|nr:VOC family protein [Streptomyces broussonetiae]QHA03075.1 VOC family protein [Streptomyces broussonetiae]